MMKARFTNYLKIKWRHLIPLLCFGMMAVQTAYADCDLSLKDAVLTLDCDGTLSVTLPAHAQVQIEADALNSTGRTPWVYSPVGHAIGSMEPGSPLRLGVNCGDDGFQTIDAGNLPTWDLMDGRGEGSYSWVSGTGWSRTGGTSTNGSATIEIVDQEDPWCPESKDGYVKVRVNENVIDKCEGASFDVTVQNADTTATITGVDFNQTVTFTGLGAGTYNVSIGNIKYSCPCRFPRPSSRQFTLVRRTGSTTSMACVSQVNLSLSEACKASLEVDDVLLGVNDPCMVAMVDSMVILGPDGSFLAGGSGSPMGLITIDNADEFLGENLTVRIYSSGLQNSCWGNVLIEDKSAPVVTCEEETLMEISCLEYDGTPMRTLEGLVEDCSDFTVNIISQNLLDKCTDLEDDILRRVVVNYNAIDVHGNQSITCEDTLNVLRFDTIAGNRRFDIPGRIWMPNNFVLDPVKNKEHEGGSDDYWGGYGYQDDCYPHHYYEVDPLRCDFDAPTYTPLEPGAVEPAPIAYNQGGTGFPILKWTDSDGRPRTSQLLPLNYAGADQAYQQIVDDNLTNCRIGVRFEDLTFQFGCKIKIQRQWFLSEWSCEGEQTVCLGVQEITVMDFEDPVFTSIVPDKTFSVGAFDCSRIEDVEFPIVEDNCDEDVEVSANIYDEDWNLISSTFFNDRTGQTFEYPLGWNYLVYIAIDDCDNFARDTAAVHIVDETPPVVICKEFLAVGLSSDGTVRVPHTAFDNGTYDDCGLEETCVIRKDDLTLLKSIDTDGDGEILFSQFSTALTACGRDYSPYAYQKNGTGPYYISEHTICTPFVEFCCADNIPAAGETEAEDIAVIFRATDINGNINNCWVFVDIQDKQVPEITCLPDVLIDCDFELPAFEASYDDLSDDPLSAYFGDIVQQNEQKAWGITLTPQFLLETDGFVDPDPKHRNDVYADIDDMVDGVYYDNCQMPTIPVTIESEIDNCGFGYIKRTYYATDGVNRTANCVQIIRIFRDEVDPAKIKWPENEDINECRIPEELVDEDFGQPTIEGDDCSLIGISTENQIFTFNTADQESDACFKILRTFTVIDWCQSTSNNGQPYVLGTHTQIIKVNDPEGPDVTCGDDIIALTLDCEEEDVMFMASAVDDCTEGADFLWSARLDRLDRDGDIVESFLLDEDDFVEDGTGKVTYTTTLPVGDHQMVWSVTDRCGNDSSCTQKASVINNKKPTPFAINVSTALMNTNGEVEIWAVDFNQKSTHPCFDDDLLQFAIVRQGDPFDPTSTNLTFTCDDAIDNYLDFYVFIVVDGQTLYDFTTVKLKVTDNGVCSNTRPSTSGTGQNAFINGTIRTAEDVNIPNIGVDLLGGNQGASALEAVVTDVQGTYAFPGMPMGGEYIISPKSDDDILNGVTTFDLVLIQKYVLGLYELESPYQLIAADVNNDKNVSALDLVELRKAILGFTDEFANNTSWRFVDAAYEFANPKNPLGENFNERYDISALEESMTIDFIGLKVADINGSVDASSVIAEGRSIHKLVAADVAYKSGEYVALELTAGKDIAISGTQFALDFDTDKLEFEGIESGALAIGAANIGTRQVGEGQLVLSWNDAYDVQLGEDDVMLIVRFRAKQSGELSQTVGIGTSNIAAEIYSSALDISNLALEYSEEEFQDGIVLYQNTPNPFADQSTISFYLPQASTATLTIHDVTGKTMRTYSGSFDKGHNNISVSTDELPGVGVMYFTLATEQFTDTKRMVVLK